LSQALAGDAQSVWVNWKPLQGPGVLTVGVNTTLPNAQQVKNSIQDTFASLRTEPISLENASWATYATAAGFEVKYQTPSDVAASLGFAQTIAGDYHWAKTFPDVIRQVSRQDLQAIATKYLTPEAIKVLVFQGTER
jgi:predicted Zn-dependent peptidase